MRAARCNSSGTLPNGRACYENGIHQLQSEMRLSASSWFLAIQRMFTGGKQVLVKLRTPADHAKVMEQLTDADAVVFAMPLYVDGIPSHVLGFLEKLERLSREETP